MRIGIIIPALDPDELLIDYVRQLLDKNMGHRILIVNDGSASSKDYIFDELSVMTKCTVLGHEQNLGKGAAIKTAIKFILERDLQIDGIITVDADGQHSIEDVVKMVRTLELRPSSMILGVRDFQSSTPLRSRIGNTCSAKALKFLYDIDLNDTQTGLRAISSSYFHWLLEIPGQRYEYELNMLIHAKKAKLEIYTIPIETLYFNNNEGSHYATFKDSARIFTHMIKGLALYISSSAVSAFVDLVLFTVLMVLTSPLIESWHALALSATVARMGSSLVNFTLNRKIFTGTHDYNENCIFRYYVLWIVQLGLSVLLVGSLNTLVSIPIILFKALIDLGLALVSYQVQLRWVFPMKALKKKKLKDGFLRV